LAIEADYFGSHGVKLGGQVINDTATIAGPGSVSARLEVILKNKTVFAKLAFWMMLVWAPSAFGQAPKRIKVFMVTDLEGVSGIFDSDLQCLPYQSKRWEESHKLETGEVNAGVDGLIAGGATDVIVWDGHDSGLTLSALDINPKCRLLQGRPIPPTMGLDSSYDAIVFVGQHAMAGNDKGILSHSYSSLGIQNIWVNGKPEGEFGTVAMIAGSFGIPVAMLSGDAAACQEVRDLTPQAECAEVKQGISRTSGYMLPHPIACALIRARAERAMERLPEMKPLRIEGPVEVKVEFTTRGTGHWTAGDGIEQLDGRTWAFRGRTFMDAWLKYRPM
jgi:D-amino peptidase